MEMLVHVNRDVITSWLRSNPAIISWIILGKILGKVLARTWLAHASRARSWASLGKGLGKFWAGSVQASGKFLAWCENRRQGTL